MSTDTTGLRFDDTTDFDDAARGFVGALEPAVIRAEDGRVVWDNDAYGFLREDCPPTANPSLWRQGQLASQQGLYEVVEGIYQVRGLDLSNVTFIEGNAGVVVVDPLISVETAAAAIALYRHHRGDRPVAGVIYTHSHVDHFGGVKGVVDGDVPILAPEGFMEHAAAENVYAGVAMTRRTTYMYGALLDRGPAGGIGAGLGMTTSTGHVSLIAPSVDIVKTGQEETIDGVRMEFQVTPGTEAPAEMNFYLPRSRALCMAENATHTLHNILTLRGALVRDARIWSRYLTESIRLFGSRSDVVFASHHWPTWGQTRLVGYLSEQRDLYAYLHDQTLRLMNAGHTGIEIAEMIELPPAIEQAWHARGYYGSISHNVKAIYQRYMGWFDGNPSDLWAHPPVAAAKRYVECLGGTDAVVEKATEYLERGDLRFAAELLKHAVFADPENRAAKERLAATYDRLGHGAENGPWRDFFLMGASELRNGIQSLDLVIASPDLIASLSVDQLFDSIAVKVNGPRVQGDRIAIDWILTDLDRTYRTTLANGVLTPEPDPLHGDVDLTLVLTKTQLLRVLAGDGLNGIDVRGDTRAVDRLLAGLDEGDPNFPIVTP